MDEYFKLELRQLLDDHEDRLMPRIGNLIERKVSQALIAAGVAKSHISKSEAYQRYGRATIDEWIKKGYLSGIREKGGSSRYRISVIELEQVAAQFNHPAAVHGPIRTHKTKTGAPYPQRKI